MKSIIEDTVLIPDIIADRAFWNALEEDKRFKDYTPEQCYNFQLECVPLLVDRADHVYINGAGQFKKMLKSKHCRDYLGMFMEHWMKLLLDQKHKCKPLSFSHRWK